MNAQNSKPGNPPSSRTCDQSSSTSTKNEPSGATAKGAATDDKSSSTSTKDGTAGSAAPAAPSVQLTQDEINKLQRDCIDQVYHANLNRRAEAAIRNPRRKLKWNPNISPDSQEWTNQRQAFRVLLASNSLADILRDHFEEGQKLLLIPPVQPGPLLDVQSGNTKEYKAFLEAGGRFHGVRDNLATKLTMLKFGFPVEPVTMKNIEGSDKPADEDDPPDEASDEPMIERILHGEKPLEFLDLYHERSYGYPILRRPKPEYQKQEFDLSAVSSAAERRAFKRRYHGGRPIFPGRPAVGMRGGAGTSKELEGLGQRFIYGDGDMKVLVTDDVNVFTRALFTLFPPNNSEDPKKRIFHLDVYNNEDKAQKEKKFQRTVDLDYGNFTHKWTGFIRHSLFNFSHDWLLRVRVHRLGTSSTAPAHFVVLNPGKELRPQPLPWEAMEQKAAPKDSSAPPATNPRQTSNTTKGFVYGFDGKLEVENTEDSFLRAALLLTGQYPAPKQNPTWTFYVDIPTTKGPRMTLNIMPANWQRLFTEAVLPNLKGGESWQVFVRTDETLPTSLEPSKSARDIIRINLTHCGTAYWKIPFNWDALEDCGINQIQPSFVSAMRLLCPEPRPRDSVHVRGFNLGVGGLEFVENSLWEWIKKELKSANTALQLDITLLPMETPKVTSGPVSVGTAIRMVGNKHVSTPNTSYWRKLADEIYIMSERYLNYGKNPALFRVWEDAEARRRNGKSAIIKYSPIDKTEDALKDFFGGVFPPIIWFRPEWGPFTIQDVDSPNAMFQWDSRPDQSLRSFRNALGDIWTDPESRASFCITEMKASGDRDFRYIVTKDTTEDEWRLFVFDWLHGENLAVKRNIKADYTLKPKNVWIPTVPGSKPDSVHADTPDTTEFKPKNSKVPELYPTTPRVPEFNLTRIMAPRAGKAGTQNYADWMANEQYQDGLHRQSYINDQKVVMPGKLPAAPIYGPSRELQIKVGASMPTVYAQRLTPTDIEQLIEENQTLRNKALERIWACPICNVSFKNYESVKIREHAQEHIKQIKEAGQCPLCGISDWAFMSADQKWEHLQWHIAKSLPVDGPGHWQQVYCPGCDMDLSRMRPQNIVAHCLGHNSSTARWCDRCGLDVEQCTNEELKHHWKVCREAPDRMAGDPQPKFCNCCGKDTSTDTRTQHLLHSRDCKPHNKSSFCTKCGFDITTLDGLQRAAHASHCTPPGGMAGKFCARCATDLSKLDTVATAVHQQTCRANDPIVSTSGNDWLASQDLNNRGSSDNTGRPGNTASPGNTSPPIGTPPILKDLGKCPINGCSCIIGTMSRDAMFKHLQSHSKMKTQAASVGPVSFKCPLRDYKGHRCNQVLSFTDNLSNFKYHFVHRGTADEQKAVQEAGNGPIDKRKEGPGGNDSGSSPKRPKTS